MAATITLPAGAPHLVAWVEGHGLDPSLVRPTVTLNDDGTTTLAVMLLDEHGVKLVAPDGRSVATRPVTVPDQPPGYRP